MIDPNEQALRDKEIGDADYQKRWEEAEKKVLSEVSTVDGFLQELYGRISDDDMESLLILGQYGGQCIAGSIFAKYYNEYVDNEIKSKLEEL